MLGSRTWLRLIEFAILRQTQLDRPTVATVEYVLQRAFASTASLGQTYGVYLENYLADDRFPEATLVDYALIGGLNLSMAMLVAPGVTVIVRKYETHASMLLGTVFLVNGFVLASFTRRIWQLYLTQGVLIGIGVGFTYVPSIPIISQWFDKKRSLANGISSAGSGIGGLIYSFLTQALISRLSFPWALLTLGSPHHRHNKRFFPAPSHAAHPKPKQGHPAHTEGIRPQAPAPFGRASIPGMGLHQHVRLYHLVVLVA
ncbi:hypothetical protein DTO164E3_9090 [Paecilomyces variotii]|nr:hypothetical protein DTO164E3_9090 [Paecilomyces variotii]KAJ9192804.1 hypothetical protein DTO032I3_8146 [Paecilomyces variotii]KAJ9274837.1 hypothetical protein DTO021D3_8272 [Paecilomyces variotii]KAJ9287424.1 hypothetical protein DTO021C3_4908 [Paecilomyces variotii]KAJ9300532.1 hypothetical protein DTO217A2_7842 [Paecilomyces variotii]